MPLERPGDRHPRFRSDPESEVVCVGRCSELQAMPNCGRLNGV